jgi:hypothetical protein
MNQADPTFTIAPLVPFEGFKDDDSGECSDLAEVSVVFE